MRLFEIEDPLISRLIVVSGQLQDAVDKEKVTAEWTVDQLLDYFQSYDITLDVHDLYNMIKKPPLKNVIANIQGDKVIFKGHDTPEAPPEKESKKVVKQMAQKAMK